MNLGEKVQDAIGLFGRFVKIKLTCEPGETAPPMENAFSFLMNNRLETKSQLHYTQNVETTSERKNCKLQNDIISMMKTRGFGFSQKTTAEKDGKSIALTLTKCFWYIFPHLQKLQSRGGKFPEFFEFLLKDNKTLEQEYNLPETHRHTPERLDCKTLTSKIQDLYKIKMEPALFDPRFDTLKQGVQELISWLEAYESNLEKTNENMNRLHQSLDPTKKRPEKGTKHIEPKLLRNDRYKPLEDDLTQRKDYEPVNLNDYLPNDYRRKYFYISELAMPFPITMTTFPSGGQKVDIHFAWKRSGGEVSIDLEDQLKDKIRSELPKYHTRAMRREFQQTVNLLSADLNSKATATALYQKLTGDESVMEHAKCKALQERLRLLIDTQDEELATDMRHMNSGRKGKFDEFWSEARKLIHEKELAAVNDRRHGTVAHMAIAISVRDFKEQVKQRLPEGTPIPCDQLVYYAFEPKNKFARSAEHHTALLPLKLAVQKRQLSADHPDGQYAATIYRYLKDMTIKYRDNCVFVCVDDKALIPLGEPGTPLASTARTKAAVVISNIPLMASDHDTNTKLKVTPSTALLCEIPESTGQSFCTGQVVSTLKDTILQPSTPIRHSAELHQILKTSEKEILFMYCDGGPDHNITFPAVQLALFALFKIENLDALIVARCCPGKSYTNPAEKPHCIMNLGLQSVALERESMGDAYEKKLAKHGTMKKIREACKKDEGLSTALMESGKPCRDAIAEVFERLYLKDQKFKVQPAATQDQIDAIWSMLTQIEPGLKQVR